MRRRASGWPRQERSPMATDDGEVRLSLADGVAAIVFDRPPRATR